MLRGIIAGFLGDSFVAVAGVALARLLHQGGKAAVIFLSVELDIELRQR